MQTFLVFFNVMDVELRHFVVSWMSNNTKELFPSQSKGPQCWTIFSTAAYAERNKVPQAKYNGQHFMLFIIPTEVHTDQMIWLFELAEI
ncbi:hypothetical protein MRB53_026267 [Persea americana]|uniref:Uncharacterized protein n=1 Tax=Persea americana TaxID=3435 RepID=A0ACC2LI80_PERAE|nr:hypothetical protein MRB53_026267 [Persea americana]